MIQQPFQKPPTQTLPTQTPPTWTLQRLVLLAALTLLLMAACSDPATLTRAEAPAAGGSTDGVLLAVIDHGGLLPVDLAVREAPRLVVMADGIVYRPAASTSDHPPPALPAVETTVLDDGELAALTRLLEDSSATFSSPVAFHPAAADAPSTAVTVGLDTGTTTIVVPSLTEATPTDLDQATAAVRNDVAAILAEVETVVDGSERSWTVGMPPALRIHSFPSDGSSGAGDDDVRVLPIPADTLFLDDVVGCFDIIGDDVETVVEVGSDATDATQWEVLGETATLIFRPLYPHEPACGSDPGPAPIVTEVTVTTPTATTVVTKPPVTKPPVTKPPVTTAPVTTRATPAADGSGCAPGSGPLPDGRWFGYVVAADDVLDFDLACWFTGTAAVRAAAEDGAESPPPNDYYVRNSNRTVRHLKPAADTPVVWYPDVGNPTSESTTTYGEWRDATTDASPRPGIWVTVAKGNVTGIEEQWVP